MEWFEHQHDDEHEEHGIQAAPGSAEWRVAEQFGMNCCRLTRGTAGAVTAAAATLFSPDLGERALFAGDEVIVIAQGESRLAASIAACGGVPVLLQLSDPVVDSEKMEALLSFSTRAVVLEHSVDGIQNPLTVRNFCNKYDLWMVECVADAWQKSYEIDGKSYAAGAIGDWSLAVQAEACALLTRDALLCSLLERHLPADGAFGRCADEARAGVYAWGMTL